MSETADFSQIESAYMGDLASKLDGNDFKEPEQQAEEKPAKPAKEIQIKPKKSEKKAQEHTDEDASEDSDDADDDDKQWLEKKKESFKFDSKTWKDKGITDEKALKEIEELERKIFERTAKLGKQGQKLGDQKKSFEGQLQAVLKAKDEAEKKLSEFSQDKYDELAISEPSKARKMAKEQEDAEAALRQYDAEALELQSKTFISGKISDFEDKVDLIADLILEDVPGEDGERVAKDFKKNPYLMQPSILLNLARRAEDRMEIKRLSSELEKSQKEAKTAPKEAVNRVKKIAEIADNSARMGQAKGESSSIDYDVAVKRRAFMSASEIRELLKNKK